MQGPGQHRRHLGPGQMVLGGHSALLVHSVEDAQQEEALKLDGFPAQLLPLLLG